MNTPVPLLQNRWEFAQLLEWMDARAPAVILEIGSLYGGTLYHWFRKSFVKRVVSVDLKPEAAYPGMNTGHDPAKVNECRAQWESWASGRLAMIEGNSNEGATFHKVGNVLAPASADMLFIDGDHRYASVKADYSLYSHFVRPGGAIVLHDIWGIASVRQFWNEVKATRSTIEFADPDSDPRMGIGIVFVPGEPCAN